MLEKMNQVNQTDGQKRIGDNTTRQPFSTNRADQFNLGKLSHKLNWLDWIAIISFRLSFFFFPFFFYQFFFFFWFCFPFLSSFTSLLSSFAAVLFSVVALFALLLFVWKVFSWNGSDFYLCFGICLSRECWYTQTNGDRTKRENKKDNSGSGGRSSRNNNNNNKVLFVPNRSCKSIKIDLIWYSC